MSYDPKLQNKCDHRINWESYSLEGDRKTVILKYPVSAVSSLGLRVNNVAAAPNTYGVVTTKKPLSLEYTSSVVMTNKILYWDPLIEVSYVTLDKTCPKCLSVKTVDDFSYTQSGDIKMAKKEYLLLQMMEKAIVTKVSSNPFHSWYGTDLHSLIGSKIVDISFTKTKIIEQVSAAVETVKNLQKSLVASNRLVDPGELFGQLLNIDVRQGDDPTIVLVTVIFTSQSNQTLEFSQLIDLSTTRERVAFA
jgi:hypothetical protein